MNSDGNRNTASMENNTSMVSGVVDNEDDSTMYGMPQSPGSFLGSSIRSNQVASFDIESESASAAGENPGWKLGMPWLTNNSNKSPKPNNQKNQELHRYYGGIMKASGESSTGPASPSSTTSSSSRHFRPFRKTNKTKSPTKSVKTKGTQKDNQKSTKTEKTKRDKDSLTVPIARSKSSTGDSIADFDDSEWTPPDSSYGAACPLCGCIPKRVRQMIEMTLITAMVFFLIYLVVRTSMKVADAHRQGGGSTGSAADSYFKRGSYNRTGTSSSSSTNVVTDDDVYVEKYSYNDDVGNTDDATAVDDKYDDDSSDDKYGDDDNANGGSGNRNNNRNYNNYGYPNRYYNKNTNYYSGYNNDDANGGRRELESSLRSSQRKRIDGHTRRL